MTTKTFSLTDGKGKLKNSRMRADYGFLKNLKNEDLAIDLGTGGGLPGLVLSTFTNCFWLLTDRGERRCDFLKKAQIR